MIQQASLKPDGIKLMSREECNITMFFKKEQGQEEKNDIICEG